MYLSKAELGQLVRLPQIQRNADKLLNVYNSHQFSFDIANLYELFRRVARAIPLDNQFGGVFAATSQYRLRSKDDPRFTDRRMQALIGSITQNLHQFNMTQLCHCFHSTVKLRLPEDALINGLVGHISEKIESEEDIQIKDLALLSWSLARIRLPPGSTLSKSVAMRADSILQDCVKNQFLFDWTSSGGTNSLANTFEQDLQKAHGSDTIHEKYMDQ